MRLALLLVFVLACESTNDGAAEQWARIEKLAHVPSTGEPHALVAAIVIAKDNRDTWSDKRATRAPLDDYPEGKRAMTLLDTWLTVGAALPAPQPLPSDRVMHVLALGELAIETATAESPRGLEIGGTLGARMVTRGANLLDATIGFTLLRDASKRAAELGVNRTWDMAGTTELVRVLAKEATYARKMTAYLTTPEGKRAATEQLAGAKIDIPDADPRETAAMLAFWLAALDGARIDEPVATTIARVKAAAKTVEHPIAKPATARIATMIEELAADLPK